MAAVMLLAAIYDRPLHIAHVSLREEILLIRSAKEKALPITCEVAPHHLFLSNEDSAEIGPGRSEVRPPLASLSDQQALWKNLDVVDVFATDHAPHTLAEKDDANPPPGFPGLETALPLFLTAIHAGRLTLDELVQKMVVNPRRIFSIPERPETWVELDLDEEWEIHASTNFTRCGWTPFEGRKVTGRVLRVSLRGRDAYRDRQIIANPGSGRNIRQMSEQF